MGKKEVNMNDMEKKSLIKKVKKLLNGERYAEALSTLVPIIVDYPDDLELHFFLAHAYWGNNQSVEAGEIAEQLVEKFPNEYLSNILFADFLRKNEKGQESVLFYDKARKLCPKDLLDDFVELYFKWGTQYWDRGNEREAVECWTAAAFRLNPNHPKVLAKIDFLWNKSSYYRTQVQESARRILKMTQTARARDPSLADRKPSDILMNEVIALNKEPQ